MGVFCPDQVSDQDLQRLCEILCGWIYCDQCIIGKACSSEQCPWSKSRKPEAFLRFYKDITWNVPEVIAESHCALRSHEDLFSIIQLLRKEPGTPRALLMKQHFAAYGDDKLPGTKDQCRAFNLALRVLTMIESSGDDHSWQLCELGLKPWHSGQTVQNFVELAIPIEQTPTAVINKQLSAKLLKRVAGLKFLGTDDLSDHLRFDQKRGFVHIYHQTAFLKMHLSATLQQVQSTANFFSM
jgi:hypothetical protein